MANWLKNQIVEFLCWVWDKAGEARARRHARRFVRRALERKVWRKRP